MSLSKRIERLERVRVDDDSGLLIIIGEPPTDAELVDAKRQVRRQADHTGVLIFESEA